MEFAVSKKDEAKRTKKKLDISAKAIIDNIVFSEKDAMAYYKVGNVTYDFLSTSMKEGLAQRILVGLGSLIDKNGKQDTLDCHLIITTVPLNVVAWKDQMIERAKKWGGDTPHFLRYVQQQAEYLYVNEFSTKTTIIGVSLGRRGALDTKALNPFDIGVKESINTLKKWGNKLLMVPGEEITSDDERIFKNREAGFFDVLSMGALKAQRLSTEDLIILMKRPFHPAMPIPRLETSYDSRVGAGELVRELYHIIENKYRFCKITQELDFGEEGLKPVTGYRATLSFSKFPKYIDYPHGSPPFLYLPLQLGVDCTIYSRFKLLSNAKMKKDIERKKKDSADQIDNAANTQTATSQLVNPDMEMINNIEDLSEIAELVHSDRMPWVQGNYRIVIEASTEERLRKIISFIRQEYENYEIVLNWTAGDQKDLLLEQMPGDKTRMTSFTQTTNLEMLATSGMNFSSEVGDVIWDGKKE